NQKKTTQLLFGFGKGAISNRRLAAADLHRVRLACALQRLSHDQFATLAKIVYISQGFIQQLQPFVVGHLMKDIFIFISKAEKFHGWSFWRGLVYKGPPLTTTVPFATLGRSGSLGNVRFIDQ